MFLEGSTGPEDIGYKGATPSESGTPAKSKLKAFYDPLLLFAQIDILAVVTVP